MLLSLMSSALSLLEGTHKDATCELDVPLQQLQPQPSARKWGWRAPSAPTSGIPVNVISSWISISNESTNQEILWNNQLQHHIHTIQKPTCHSPTTSTYIYQIHVCPCKYINISVQIHTAVEYNEPRTISVKSQRREKGDNFPSFILTTCQLISQLEFHCCEKFPSCPVHSKFPGKHSSCKLTVFSNRGIFNTLSSCKIQEFAVV